MKQTFSNIKKISFDELQTALTEISISGNTNKIALTDMFYLINTLPYQEKVSSEDKTSLEKHLLAKEHVIKYDICNPFSDNPYLLKKYLMIAYFYIEKQYFPDYWYKVVKLLYKNLVQLYGHDMYTISKVDLYGLWFGIKKMQTTSSKQLAKWTAVNFPEQRAIETHSFYLKEVDVLYLLLNHPQKDIIPADDKEFFFNYINKNYIDLQSRLFAHRDNMENEYEMRKKYVFLKFLGEEYNFHRHIYQDILNEDFAANLPSEE